MTELESQVQMGNTRNGVLNALRSLFILPSRGKQRWGAAVQATLAITVPLGICTALDQQGLGLQASAGAFTALYGTQASARERAKILPFVALTLVLCALLGAALTPSAPGFLIGLVLVAAGTSALSFAFRLGPPGPVFFVLVYGLASNVTEVVDGQRANDPLVFIAATALGAGFAYLLAIAPLLLKSVRRLPTRPLRTLLPGPWFGPDEQLLTIRILVSSIIGAAISLAWLDSEHAYWTVCASVAVVGLAGGRTVSFTRGLHRTVGTLVGAAIYLAIAPLGTNPWVLLAMIGALQFTIELVVVRNYALGLMFVTPLVLLITASVNGAVDPTGTALDRVADTVVGVILAVATSLLHRSGGAGKNPPGVATGPTPAQPSSPAPQG